MKKYYTVDNEISKNDSHWLNQILKARVGKDSRGCIRCGSDPLITYSRLQNKKKLICKRCRLHVSPMAGTPMEQSHVSLKIWFDVIKDILHSSTGIHPEEIQHRYFISYNTSLELISKVRQWMERIDGVKIIRTRGYLWTGSKETMPCIGEFATLPMLGHASWISKEQRPKAKKYVTGYSFRYEGCFSPEEILGKMLGLLPPLFKRERPQEKNNQSKKLKLQQWKTHYSNSKNNFSTGIGFNGPRIEYNLSNQMTFQNGLEAK
jgi:transposase-like protein